MQKYQGKLINPAQTGFIPGCQGANNIRTALNLQSVARDSMDPSMLLNSSQSYLNHTVERMGFNSTFIRWINTSFSEAHNNTLRHING